nr:hypothetical protein BaRGS_013289 [Batillaria attramentaria]
MMMMMMMMMTTTTDKDGGGDIEAHRGRHKAHLSVQMVSQPVVSGSEAEDDHLVWSCQLMVAVMGIRGYLDNTEVVCKRKLRMGKVGDGGWEVCDDYEYRPIEPCIVYSFGIAYDFSFDDDVAKLYGCHVYSFDPSMGVSSGDRSPWVHFYNIGLGGEGGKLPAGAPTSWEVDSFAGIRRKLEHQKKPIDIVKMDIELSEWQALLDMCRTGELTNVRQLLVEFHLFEGSDKEECKAAKLINNINNNINNNNNNINSNNNRCSNSANVDTDLDKDLRDKTDSDPVEVCNAWCARQAEAEYPGIGKTPHAVPDHFIGAHKAKKLCPCDITDRENSFFENAEQYSQVRGDKAQRTIGRAFRMLSAVLEKEGKSAMFIISQLSYDNLLAFLRRCGKLPEGFRKQFEKVFADEPSYINIPAHLEQRGELDLMILHEEKGVIFVQIKGILNEKEQQAAAYKEQRETGKTEQKVTTEVKQAKATIQKKIKNAEKQLDHDVCIFECLMSRSGTPESHGEQVKPTGPPPVKVTRVVALPNLTKKDIEDNEIESKQDSLFLLKEDLFEEDMNLAECETDLSNFRRWWDRLPAAPMRRDYMQEIVGKYIGPFSSALTSKDGNERERQRQYRDSVQRTALLLSRNMLSRRQLDILKISDPKETKRVYLSGPPGSGKTVLLTSKARSFLETSEKHHVIVLNMYRGAAGRAIGERIFTAVSSGGKKQRVHKVDVDVTEGSFDKANFVKGVKRLNPGSKHWLKNALFIVDEIYVESFWQKILNAFKSEFSESSVWCAGLFSRTPTGFREYKLYCVYRCPPSVQNLLYQVDWDDTRKTFYKRDAEQAEVPTNGPIPLCILHEKHANVSVTECVQCAEELAVVLNDKKLAQLVQPRENPSEPGGASSTPDLHADYSDIKLTFLVNLPRELYERNVSYLETSKARYTKYMDYVARCPFIKTLIEKGVDVDVKTDLACKDLNGPCTATWLYNFQGLETTVVVFLPGDTPRDGRSQASAQRDIPAPGLRTKDFEGDADFDLPVVNAF